MPARPRNSFVLEDICLPSMVTDGGARTAISSVLRGLLSVEQTACCFHPNRYSFRPYVESSHTEAWSHPRPEKLTAAFVVTAANNGPLLGDAPVVRAEMRALGDHRQEG